MIKFMVNEKMQSREYTLMNESNMRKLKYGGRILLVPNSCKNHSESRWRLGVFAKQAAECRKSRAATFEAEVAC